MADVPWVVLHRYLPLQQRDQGCVSSPRRMGGAPGFKSVSETTILANGSVSLSLSPNDMALEGWPNIPSYTRKGAQQQLCLVREVCVPLIAHQPISHGQVFCWGWQLLGIFCRFPNTPVCRYLWPGCHGLSITANLVAGHVACECAVLKQVKAIKKPSIIPA